MAAGIDVDTDELDTAATLVRRAVEHGEAEDACYQWSFDYGHDELAAAAQEFLADSDRALQQHLAVGRRIADGLSEQAVAYRSVDDAVKRRVAGLSQVATTGSPTLVNRPV